MKYPIYEQCINSIKSALETLEFLNQRGNITYSCVQSIRLRRRTADIAMRGTFDELRHAFITPIDREDLLRMRQVCESVTYHAEEVTMLLFAQKQSALPCEKHELLQSVIHECRLLKTALESFPDFPRSDDTVNHITNLIRRHRNCEEQYDASPHGTALKNVSAACVFAAETLLCILLKVA